jgi:hypothetical protein
LSLAGLRSRPLQQECGLTIHSTGRFAAHGLSASFHFRPKPVRRKTPVSSNVKFQLAFYYFVDTIKYGHMGRTQAQAEPQESRA